MSVKLSARRVECVSVLDASGRITLGEESSTIREALRGMIANSHKKILLNLAEVSYIDSSDIRELLTALNEVKTNGGEMKVVNLTPRVKDLMQITRLYTVFDVHDDEAAALRSFG